MAEEKKKKLDKSEKPKHSKFEYEDADGLSIINEDDVIIKSDDLLGDEDEDEGEF